MPFLVDLFTIFGGVMQVFENIITRHKENKNYDVKHGFTDIENGLSLACDNKIEAIPPEEKEKMVKIIEKENELIANHTDFFGKHHLHGKMKHRAIKLAEELEALGVDKAENSTDVFSQKATALIKTIQNETHHKF